MNKKYEIKFYNFFLNYFISDNFLFYENSSLIFKRKKFSFDKTFHFPKFYKPSICIINKEKIIIN